MKDSTEFWKGHGFRVVVNVDLSEIVHPGDGAVFMRGMGARERPTRWSETQLPESEHDLSRQPPAPACKD